MGWTDRIIGIVVGVVLGLGVLVFFVFDHSESTIDAPKISGTEAGQTTAGSGSPPAHPGSPEQLAEGGKKSGGGSKSGARRKKKSTDVPVVRVLGGAPPIGAGPKQLTFRKGQEVRFEIDTDEPFSFEIKGLGVKKSIEGDAIVSFKAPRTGQFPVIATATLIGVADLLIKPAR